MQNCCHYSAIKYADKIQLEVGCMKCSRGIDISNKLRNRNQGVNNYLMYSFYPSINCTFDSYVIS